MYVDPIICPIFVKELIFLQTKNYCIPDFRLIIVLFLQYCKICKSFYSNNTVSVI